MRLVSILLFAAGCTQSGIDEPVAPAEADVEFFRCEAQPVIAARCSFMDCHGNDERPFRVYAEQRHRLGVSWSEFETPLLPEELSANFEAARGFIATSDRDDHLLTEKPLDTRAGGMFHRGKDLYGADDVFLTRDDIGYQILLDFAGGQAAGQDCTPREEVGF